MKHKKKGGKLSGIIEKEWGPQKKCARGSIRTKVVNDKLQLLICCPPGKWDAKRKKCKVGTRLHAKHHMG